MLTEEAKNILNNIHKEIDRKRDNIINTIISLNTGSIVISITFLEKIFSNAKFYLFIILSWGFLLLSILFGIFSKFIYLKHENKMWNLINNRVKNEKGEILVQTIKSWWENLIIFLYICFFIIGIILLILFAVIG